MKTKKVLIILCLILIPFYQVSAQNIIALTPTPETIDYNETVSLTLSVDQVDNLFGLSFQVNFDPTLLSFESFDVSNSLFNDLPACTALAIPVETSAGVYDIAISRIGMNCFGVSGGGELGQITFKAKTETGDSDISFTNAKISTYDGTDLGEVTGTWNGSSISVLAPSIAIGFSTTTKEVSTDSAFSLLITSPEINNLNFLGFNLSFDEDVVSFESVSAKGFLASAECTELANAAETAPGEIQITLSHLGLACYGFSGSGDLLEINFSSTSTAANTSIETSDAFAAIWDYPNDSYNNAFTMSPVSLSVVGDTNTDTPVDDTTDDTTNNDTNETPNNTDTSDELTSPITTETNDYENSKISVGEAWEHGTDEHWHLNLVGEKGEFQVGEKVQFFAQVGPIFKTHTWSMGLYEGDTLVKEIINDTFTPDPTYGWNFSNFVPYEYHIAPGSYTAKYFLEVDGQKNQVGSAEFNINLPPEDYIFSHATTSLSWEQGAEGEEYWNLKPLGERNYFEPGDTVHLMVQVQDIYKDHRYKVELFRDTTMLWDYEASLLEVGAGWKYSNFYPYYEQAKPGNYRFKTYIDTGDGYQELAVNEFVVTGELADYVFDHSYATNGWEYGVDTEYWNIVPTDISDQYTVGDTIHSVTQIRNVYVDHQWKLELWRHGQMAWDYEAPLNQVGSGWTYGNFLPYYANAEAGYYEFKVYLKTENEDYKLLDTKPFTVREAKSDYEYYGMTIASDWQYGEGDEYYNLAPVDPKANYSIGDTIYALTYVKNITVDHKWKAELYNYGLLVETTETDLLVVDSIWSYDIFKPYTENTTKGNYEYKIFIDTGSGYEMIDTRTFSVN